MNENVSTADVEITEKDLVNTQAHEAVVPRKMFLPFVLITSCFALWGIANNMTDVLVSTFKQVMSFSTMQASLIQFAFYIAYFCMAIPAALVIQKFSYKSGVVAGLFVYATGAFLCYPAAQSLDFNFFLVAFFVFAAGCAFLESSCAPYILSMGSAETATRRINLARAFNPIGCISGILLGKYVILANLDKSTEAEKAMMTLEQIKQIKISDLSYVVTAYVIVGMVGFAVGTIILLKKFPKHHAEESFGKLGAAIGRLSKNKNYLASVAIMFVYVGAQVSTWTYIIDYVMGAGIGISDKATASNFMIYSMILFTISRFITTALMKTYSPATIMKALAFFAVVFACLAVFVGGLTGCVALVGISGCMSLMFPTIYGLGLTGVGQDTKLAGSGIIMGIAGGAIFPFIQAAIIDTFKSSDSYNQAGNQAGYSVQIICFSLIAIYSLYARKVEKELTDSL